VLRRVRAFRSIRRYGVDRGKSATSHAFFEWSRADASSGENAATRKRDDRVKRTATANVDDA